jgi:hypothetical protein
MEGRRNGRGKGKKGGSITPHRWQEGKMEIVIRCPGSVKLMSSIVPGHK